MGYLTLSFGKPESGANHILVSSPTAMPGATSILSTDPQEAGAQGSPSEHWDLWVVGQTHLPDVSSGVCHANSIGDFYHHPKALERSFQNPPFYPESCRVTTVICVFIVG